MADMTLVLPKVCARPPTATARRQVPPFLTLSEPFRRLYLRLRDPLIPENSTPPVSLPFAFSGIYSGGSISFLRGFVSDYFVSLPAGLLQQIALFLLHAAPGVKYERQGDDSVGEECPEVLTHHAVAEQIAGSSLGSYEQ